MSLSPASQTSQPQEGPTDDFVLVSETESDTDSFVHLSDSDTEYSGHQLAPETLASNRRISKLLKKANKSLPKPPKKQIALFSLDYESLSMHRKTSLNKRAASAPCRSRFVQLLASNVDSDTESVTSTASSTISIPAPFSPGALAHNPNDQDSPASALLRNRVDRLRSLKLSGTIVNYVDRSKRKNKSIAQKLDGEQMHAFLRGATPTPATHAPNIPDVSPTLTLDAVPSSLLPVLKRILTPDSPYIPLETFLLTALLTASATPTFPQSKIYRIYSTKPTSVTFEFPPTQGKDFGALTRIFLHGVAAFHGFTGQSRKGRGGMKYFDVGRNRVDGDEERMRLSDAIRAN